MTERDINLFRRVLSQSFDQLPASLKRLHDERSLVLFAGHCVVERGRNPIARALAAVTRLPPQSSGVSLRVTIERTRESERWQRDFDGHRMSSRLWSKDRLLAERMGPLVLLFALQVTEGRIAWRVAGARYLGFPLPVSWFYATTAIEHESDGRYHFEVRASLPVIGLLVRYRGWLDEERT